MGQELAAIARVRLLTWQGTTRSITEWARLSGMPAQTLRSRLVRGQPLDLAMRSSVLSREAAGRSGALRSPWLRVPLLLRTTT